MGKASAKVVYKPDSQSTDEYILIVNPEEYKKWKAGDTSIPLADVVDSFEVFHSGQGPQGILGRPSKQQLDTVFDTHNENEVVRIILEKGREQSSEGIQNSRFSTTNVARNSASLDSRGKGLSGV